MKKNKVSKVRFHYLVSGFHLRERSALKNFIAYQLKAEGKKIEAINYIFCSDKELLEVNRKYLNHDTYTDIVTFELSLTDEPLLSDIYISVERVKDNAVRFTETFTSELLRVIFHGALHLIGFSDKTSQQKAAMRKKEDEWLNLYNVPREKGNSKINRFPVKR